MMKKQQLRHAGFTIVELLVVIVVIGILAAITITAYGGIQKRSYDASVVSDVSNMQKLQMKYAVLNEVVGKAYYSDNGADSDLGYSPNNDNVIDVTVNSSGYCIRAYNIKATNNSIYNALTRESVSGVCSDLDPSNAAAADYSGPKLWKQVSGGGNHVCGIATDSKVYCWGQNNYGQLGINVTDSNSHTAPSAVYTTGTAMDGKMIKQVMTGDYHSCALDSDNIAYCWGYNAAGQFGNNSTTDTNYPVRAENTGAMVGKTIKSLVVSGSTNCVIANENNLAYCSGYNGYGLLGSGGSGNSSIPVAVDTTGAMSGLTFLAIQPGQFHSCAIASNGLAFCWGYGPQGQLGYGTANSTTPVKVNDSGVLNGKTLKAISVGEYHTCAIASNNAVYCWGNNDVGQLGINSTGSYSSSPIAVNTTNGVSALYSKTVKSITSRSGYNCVIANDSNAYCWGSNSSGQLGDNRVSGSLSNKPVAVNIANGVSSLYGKTLKSVSAGITHICSISNDYQMHCWGLNHLGQIGDGSTTQRNAPILTQSPPQ